MTTNEQHAKQLGLMLRCLSIPLAEDVAALEAAIIALRRSSPPSAAQQDLVILPAVCVHCDGPLTCDPQMREALAGEKHLVAQLLDRAEKAEAELRALVESVAQRSDTFNNELLVVPREAYSKAARALVADNP